MGSSGCRTTRTGVTVTHNNFFPRVPNSDVRHGFLPRTFDSCVFTVVIRRNNLLNNIVIVVLCLVLLCETKIITQHTSSVFKTILIVNIALLVIVRTFVRMYITAKFKPIANRPLPLVDHNKASALAGYFCVNLVVGMAGRVGGEAGRRPTTSITMGRRRVAGWRCAAVTGYLVSKNNANKRVFPTVDVTGTLHGTRPSYSVLFMNTRNEVRVRHIPTTNCPVRKLHIRNLSHGHV